MLHKTKIGVCVDESVAYLLEEKNDENIITIIEAAEEQPAGMNSLETTNVKHQFFKNVFDAVKDFDKIMLFGPLSARKEILNRIRANKLHIEIMNKATGENVTENQKIEFINQYFSH